MLEVVEGYNRASTRLLKDASLDLEAERAVLDAMVRVTRSVLGIQVGSE